MAKKAHKKSKESSQNNQSKKRPSRGRQRKKKIPQSRQDETPEEYVCSLDDWPEIVEAWVVAVAIAVDKLLQDSGVSHRFQEMLSAWLAEVERAQHPIELIPERRAMTLLDQYATLAAIRDQVCERVKRVNQWEFHKCKPHKRPVSGRAMAGISFELLLGQVKEVYSKGRQPLADSLLAVARDLQKLGLVKTNELEGVERTAKEVTAGQPSNRPEEPRAVPGRPSAKFTAKADTEQTDTSKLLSWHDNRAEFVPANDAVTLAKGKISLSRLSKLLTPDGPIRYMRQGRRCKVHVQDWCKYVRTLKPEITDEQIDAYLKGVQQRQAEGHLRKVSGK